MCADAAGLLPHVVKVDFDSSPQKPHGLTSFLSVTVLPATRFSRSLRLRSGMATLCDVVRFVFVLLPHYYSLSLFVWFSCTICSISITSVVPEEKKNRD